MRSRSTNFGPWWIFGWALKREPFFPVGFCRVPSRVPWTCKPDQTVTLQKIQNNLKIHAEFRLGFPWARKNLNLRAWWMCGWA